LKKLDKAGVASLLERAEEKRKGLAEAPIDTDDPAIRLELDRLSNDNKELKGQIEALNHI